MEKFEKPNVDPEMIMENMITGAAKIWESITSMQTPESATEPSEDHESKGSGNENPQEAWAPAYNTWMKFAGQLNKKGVFEGLTGSKEDGLNAVEKLYQASLESYSLYQKKFMESAQNIEKIVTEKEKETTGKIDVIKLFNEVYKKEVSKIFSVPQLGLSREYQEKMRKALDKSNIFNGALTEFVCFLYEPFEKSFEIVQETLEGMVKEGNMPEDENDYYKMWIEQLEKHYMLQFKSSEYLDSLGKVVATMSDFKHAQQLVVHDCVKAFGFPVEEEMNDLYKDIYYMKKKIKKLEKELGITG